MMPRSPTGAAALSIVSNSLLVGVKLAVGLLSGSLSILSQAVDSGTDLVASFIAFFGLRMARAPADRSHPFGHGKFEGVSGLLQAGLILLAAIFIVHEALDKIKAGTGVEFAELGMAVMAVSAVVDWVVSRYLLKMAKSHDSLALEANARHLTTDVFTSLGVLVGVVAVKVTHVNWLDPVVAIAVALFITKTAFELTWKAATGLVDTSLPQSELDTVRGAVDEHSGEVIGFHDLRTRKAGYERYIELHLVFAKDAHVEEAHLLCDHMEADIQSKLSHSHVTIHVEPCTVEDCPHQCPLHRPEKCEPVGAKASS